MSITAHDDEPRRSLSAEVIAQARASLARICAATREAESLVDDLLELPAVQSARELRRAAAAAHPPLSESSLSAQAAAVHAIALELLSAPCERWSPALTALTPHQQKQTLQQVNAAVAAFARTEPQRAHRLAGCILQVTRHDRLPRQAPLFRRELAGRALLARASALIALRAYADALPVIADAHAAFPGNTSHARDRMHAQLLRGQVLAATGHAVDALRILNACAHFAIHHLDPRALVDALTSTAVLLCVHHEYATARSALALAAHVATRPGNEELLPALQASFAECSFLGYRVSA